MGEKGGKTKGQVRGKWKILESLKVGNPVMVQDYRATNKVDARLL